VGVVLITPADEMPQLTGVAIDGLLAASAAALLQETLQQQLIPPEDSSCLSSVEKTRDESQCLRLVHAAEDGRDLGNSFGNTSLSSV